MKNELLNAMGLLLSLLIVTPPFLSISSTAQTLTQPRIVSVESDSSRGWLTGTMGSYNVTKQVERYTRIEKWTNGTKGYFSTRIFNDNSQYSDMWVNCTAWLPENLTIPQTSSSSTSSFQPLSEGNLPRYPKDNLWFINGRNSTCYTTYEHDDNYETYYPLQWNTPYDLKGQTKTHLHLTNKLLGYWQSDNITTAAVMGICVVGYDYILEHTTGGIDPLDLPKSILETLIVQAVADVFDCEAATAVTVLFVLADIIEKIWQYVTKWYWIEYVVKEHFGGDGWAWRGPFDEAFACIVINPYAPWGPGTVYNWHRIYFYNQTWGSDGVFGTPQLYAFDAGFDHQTCSPPGPPGVTWR